MILFAVNEDSLILCNCDWIGDVDVFIVNLDSNIVDLFSLLSISSLLEVGPYILK